MYQNPVKLSPTESSNTVLPQPLQSASILNKPSPSFNEHATLSSPSFNEPSISKSDNIFTSIKPVIPIQTAINESNNLPVVSIHNNNIVLKIHHITKWNLRDIYSMLYFKTVELEFIVTMTGGWYQDYNNLTYPFKYIIYALDNTQNQEVKINKDSGYDDNKNQDNSNTNESFFQKIKNFIIPDNKSEPVKPDESESDESDESDEPDEPDEPDESESDESDSSDEPDEPDELNEPVEPVKSEPVEPVKSEPVEPVKSEPVESEPVEPVKSEPVEPVKSDKSPTPDAPDTITIQFKMETDIENNGKCLKDILKECKRAPRTIETIDESGMTYILLDRIVFDVYSQITYLTEHFKIVYSEFREEYIYNINGRYVIIDSEKLTQIDDTKPEFIQENNKLFAEYIQKLKFGEVSMFQPTNDTIIENTNVEKLRYLLLNSL